LKARVEGATGQGGGGMGEKKAEESSWLGRAENHVVAGSGAANPRASHDMRARSREEPRSSGSRNPPPHTLNDLPTYFFSNSPVKWRLTNVVLPTPPSPTRMSLNSGPLCWSYCCTAAAYWWWRAWWRSW